MATIETIGPSGCDYTTPQAWYDAHTGNITGDANAPYIGEIEAGTYPALAMGDSITDSTHYFHLRAAAGHEFRGILDDPADPYSFTENTYAKIFSVYCADDYSRFEHIGVAPHDGTAFNWLWYLSGSYIQADSCALQDATHTSAGLFGWHIVGDNITLRLCAAARLSATAVGASATAFYLTNIAGLAAFHCVAHDITADANAAGFWLSAAASRNQVLRNCVVGTLSGATTASVDGGELSSEADYNAVSDAGTYAGPNSQTNLVPATEFVNASSPNMDLHLAATSAKCAGNAGSLAGYSGAPSEDIDDQAIGADIGIDTVPGPASGAFHGDKPYAAGLASVAVTASGAFHGSQAWAEGHDTLQASGAFHGSKSHASGLAVVAVASAGACHGQQAHGTGSAAAVTRHYVDARGVYRVWNAAVYRFYRSNTAPPEEDDTPFATAASLPATPADTFADGTWYLSCSYFNGIYDSGFLEVGPHGETYLTLVIVGGVLQEDPPVGPEDWSLSQRPGGVVRITAYVHKGDNVDAPDQWAIAYTVDESDPPVSTPDVTEAIVEPQIFGGGMGTLEYDLPAQADGTVVTVRLQTRRNDGTDLSPVWIYSVASETQSITVSYTAMPTAPLAGVTWPGALEIEEGP